MNGNRATTDLKWRNVGWRTKMLLWRTGFLERTRREMKRNNRPIVGRRLVDRIGQLFRMCVGYSRILLIFNLLLYYMF
jgi:hypothetical protein